MATKSIKFNNYKIMFGIAVVIISTVIAIFNSTNKKSVEIREWNNFYNENNIKFFYRDSLDEDLQKLNERYKIQEYVSSETSEFERVLKATDVVRQLVEKDDVKSTNLTTAYNIIEKIEGSKKVNFKDMAIVAKDIISCLGVTTRIGEFKCGDSEKRNQYEYYVVEYWSSDYNKWVMIDFLDKGYFVEGDSKLSSIEIINKKLKDISYMGNTAQNDYKNNIKKYLDSYYLKIENSGLKMRSNCYVSYIKSMNALELKYKDKFAQPTIFTEESKLFEKSPFDSSLGSDEKAYLLITMSYLTDDEENKNGVEDKGKDKKIIGEKLFISAFKDDKVINSYYLNINGLGYEKIDKYKEIELNKGLTTIELSLDGENKISNVAIQKN